MFKRFLRATALLFALAVVVFSLVFRNRILLTFSAALPFNSKARITADWLRQIYSTDLNSRIASLRLKYCSYQNLNVFNVPELLTFCLIVISWRSQTRQTEKAFW